MRFLIVALLLPVSAQAAEVPKCRSPLVVTSVAAGLRPFGEVEAASHYLAVYRRVDGCPAPVIVRYDVNNIKKLHGVGR